MNLSLFGLAGMGTISIGDKNILALNVGAGKKFYFTPNLALRLDLRLLFHSGPDPTSKRLLKTSEEYAVSEFDKTYFTHFVMTFGLAYLL